MSADLVLTEVLDDHIYKVTLNRPEKRNAVNPALQEAAWKATQRFKENDDLWVMLLTAAGDKAFCAGADLQELILGGMSGAYDPVEIGLTTAGFLGLTRNYDCYKPIVVAVNGHCLAGGTETILACDLRIAAEHATFGLTETKWAILPGAGGTQRLPRSITLARAMEIILVAEPISAQTALEWGLINKVVPADQLQDEALQLCRTLLERGPLALRNAKRAMIEGMSLPLKEGMKLEGRMFVELQQTEDAREGPMAFMQKRKPEFKGK